MLVGFSKRTLDCGMHCPSAANTQVGYSHCIVIFLWWDKNLSKISWCCGLLSFCHKYVYSCLQHPLHCDIFFFLFLDDNLFERTQCRRSHCGCILKLRPSSKFPKRASNFWDLLSLNKNLARKTKLGLKASLRLAA